MDELKQVTGAFEVSERQIRDIPNIVNKFINGSDDLGEEYGIYSVMQLKDYCEMVFTRYTNCMKLAAYAEVIKAELEKQG